MSDPQQVIDDIAALVDAELAAGQSRSGYDNDDPAYPDCRCGRKWHGLPIGSCRGAHAEDVAMHIPSALSLHAPLIWSVRSQVGGVRRWLG